MNGSSRHVASIPGHAPGGFLGTVSTAIDEADLLARQQKVRSTRPVEEKNGRLAIHDIRIASRRPRPGQHGDGAARFLTGAQRGLGIPTSHTRSMRDVDATLCLPRILRSLRLVRCPDMPKTVASDPAGPTLYRGPLDPSPDSRRRFEGFLKSFMDGRERSEEGVEAIHHEYCVRPMYRLRVCSPRSPHQMRSVHADREYTCRRCTPHSWKRCWNSGRASRRWVR